VKLNHAKAKHRARTWNQLRATRPEGDDITRPKTGLGNWRLFDRVFPVSTRVAPECVCACCICEEEATDVSV
jgi:hypothetical protein